MSVLSVMRNLLAITLVSLLAIARPGLRAMPQKTADIDPNALADALMGFMGAQISDDVDLTDDSAADEQAQHDQMMGEANRHLYEEMEKARNKSKQDEDVIPINGDSSSAVDEVMDGGEPGFHLISLLTPAAPQPQTLQRPFMVFTGFRDGAIQMRVFSPRGLSATVRNRLAKSHLVLVPLSDAGKQRVESFLRQAAPRGSRVHVTSMPVRGYCVDAAKLPPVDGETFIAAGRATQEQFRPAKTVRIAAEYAASHGYLHPQGDAAAYGRFAAQYAMWTSIEHWDQARFTNELLSRTKQQMAAAKKPWTSETEQTLRALAPARWRDVQLVIEAAGRVDAKRRASGGAQ